MLTKEEILKFLKENKKFFRENFQVTKIGLFGSYARNEQDEASDIDILIELERTVPDIFNTKKELRKYIKESLDKEVDIGREKYLKPYFANYISKEVLYA
ncbi:nucleotidyltransferase domain-containing protein [Patescibacteria group bacterium]|nr:nucleotidyltransferase domain-containing protein [Patescibacteria group bacterium]MBU4512498.1 nucleotidyltransferase domain-containing protein [Patescibacteria group bacterium]MCG2693523.1 nucleotidyltransferase domain-containing protein [Candidatus Parcubacteria bacterium]